MKKTSYLSFVLVASLLILCQCGRSDHPEKSTAEEQKEPSLIRLWETPDELTTCESVLVDESAGTIYVSNIAGGPLKKDGNGFISTISKAGEILEKGWVTGLNAPKGMGVHHGKLYVTDIDELVEIDIASASISQTWPVEGAEFLNDVDVHEGKVFFSDMNSGTIHVLENGRISTLAENQERINGFRPSTKIKWWHTGWSIERYCLIDPVFGEGKRQLPHGRWFPFRRTQELVWETGAELLIEGQDLCRDILVLPFLPLHGHGGQHTQT